MKLLPIAFSLMYFLYCTGKMSQYQSLLDAALKNNALFVFSKPISDLKLDKNDIRWYVESLREWSGQTLDTSMFLQIIENSKKIDTAVWTDDEIPFVLLVNSRDEFVSKKYAIKKFSLVDKKQRRFYNKRINQFNRQDPVYRDITYFSKPVFDNTGKFAVVQQQNGHGWLGGGGNIILYRLQDSAWKEVGIIVNWRY